MRMWIRGTLATSEGMDRWTRTWSGEGEAGRLKGRLVQGKLICTCALDVWNCSLTAAPPPLRPLRPLLPVMVR